MKEKCCEYKGRRYSVREDGSIYRHAREGSKPSKLDNVWTFGIKDERTGYMLYGGARVHQIVATAFHGIPDDLNMVVDHKDTNRCNNRPENLSWVTRLENVLNNPYTRKRIEYLCGSIEAFLENPSILRESSSEPNTKWMRAVSKDEAAKCLKNLDRWIAEDAEHEKAQPIGGIGDWIFKDAEFDGKPKVSWGPKSSWEIQKKQIEDENRRYYEEQYGLKDSLTPGSKQLNWKTPCEFPLVPKVVSETPLIDYLRKLSQGEVFSRNQYNESPIVKADISDDGKKLAVLCELRNNATSLALTKVTYENGSFIHENIRSFFTEEGAEKYYTETLGKEWTGGDVFEDFC